MPTSKIKPRSLCELLLLYKWCLEEQKWEAEYTSKHYKNTVICHKKKKITQICMLFISLNTHTVYMWYFEKINCTFCKLKCYVQIPGLGHSFFHLPLSSANIISAFFYPWHYKLQLSQLVILLYGFLISFLRKEKTAYTDVCKTTYNFSLICWQFPFLLLERFWHSE